MSEAMTRRSPGIHKRMLLVLGAAMAGVVIFCSVAASAAHAEGPFCERAYLQPFGHNGDRCWGPGRTGFQSASVITFERAGCVDIANGANELMFSWVCGPAGSSPGFAASIYDFNHEGIFRKGVIRNNNLSFAAYFTGHEIYSL